jgi:hypothetical protein
MKDCRRGPSWPGKVYLPHPAELNGRMHPWWPDRSRGNHLPEWNCAQEAVSGPLDLETRHGKLKKDRQKCLILGFSSECAFHLPQVQAASRNEYPARLFHGHDSGEIAIKTGDGGGIVSVSWRSTVGCSGGLGCGARRRKGAVLKPPGIQGGHVSSRKSQNRYTFNSMTMSGIGKKVSLIPAQRDAHVGPVSA